MYEYHVKEVTKVVDGDTIYVVADLGFYLNYNVKLRLADIDTPEVRGEKDPVLREQGFKCRDYATRIIEEHMSKGHVLMLQTTGKPDKYGRWLGDLWFIGGDYIDEGAVSYTSLMEKFLAELNA